MSDNKGTNSISRRSFLGTGVAAGSAVLMVSQSARAQAESTDDLRCGFIGIGGRGMGDLTAIHKSPGVRVSALCDINEANLDRAAKAVADDKPRLFKNYKDLVSFKDLDAVFIATPCNLHAEMAIAVLESGRNCYCEKPMAITMKDLNAVYASTKKAKGVFQIGTQLRYGSPWGPAIEMISGGKFGKPIMVRAYRNNASDFPRNGWFEDPVQSGDVMLEQAVHEFDIFNAVLGGVPKRASGFGGQAMRASKGPMHDFFTLSLDYGDNKVVGYTHSWIAVPNIGCDGFNEFVYCEDGAVDIHGGNIYHRESKIVAKPAEGDKPAQMTNKEAIPVDSRGDLTQNAVDDFFRCCRSGSRPVANADTGRDAVLVGLMARKALREGRVVTLEEVLAEG
jgi:predicted dehydrogenase